jgi:hypothetical protein
VFGEDGAWLVRGREIGAEAGEGFVGGDRRQWGGSGVKPVTEAVAGGVAFAGGRDGSAGSGAVEARGFALAFCAYHGLIMHEEYEGDGIGWGGGVYFV